MTEFDCFSAEALGFLNDLKANNERDWFHANKKTYENEVKKPTAAFAAAFADALGTFAGKPHGSKVYRINRDVRFSKDKTPYNTHIHISFAAEPMQANAPMWFFGLDTEKLTLGCGVFEFDKQGLPLFREAMSGEAGNKMLTLIGEMQTANLRVSEPSLKTVPRGYDKDHPNAEALKRKGLSVWRDIPEPSFVTKPDLVSRSLEEFENLLPVYRFLDEASWMSKS